MVTNYLKLVLLITATPIMYGNSCNKNGSKPCTMVTPYIFSVTSEFSPQKEIYNIGDTIFLTSTFPTNLTNLISNQQADYSNSVGIGGDIGFVLLGVGHIHTCHPIAFAHSRVSLFQIRLRMARAVWIARFLFP